jgi:hypothetical protein
MGAVVARDSGPRTVSQAPPSCRVTTISQCRSATEMNDSAGSLQVCHVDATRGDADDPVSNRNSSTARFMILRPPAPSKLIGPDRPRPWRLVAWVWSSGWGWTSGG